MSIFQLSLSLGAFLGLWDFCFRALNPAALPPKATLVTLSFVIHGWMVVVCVFSSTCCGGHITAAALNSGLITSHVTHLTSSPAPHNLLFPSIPSRLCFSSWTCPVLHPNLSSLVRRFLQYPQCRWPSVPLGFPQREKCRESSRKANKIKDVRLKRCTKYKILF